jgi:hypothetical protein
MRAHLRQHDDRLLDAFNEAEAFAWAVDVAKVGVPVFSALDPGAPDLRIPRRAWIEVKTIRPSDEESKTKDEIFALVDRGFIPMRGPRILSLPHPTLITKFDEKYADALRKFELAESEPMSLVYFRVEAFDFGTSPRQAKRSVEEWLWNCDRPQKRGSRHHQGRPVAASPRLHALLRLPPQRRASALGERPRSSEQWIRDPEIRPLDSAQETTRSRRRSRGFSRPSRTTFGSRRLP